MKIGDVITINEFAQMLKGIGFEDITEYERK